MQGGCPQTVSTETDHLDSRYRVIRKITHAMMTLGLFYYSALATKNPGEDIHEELYSLAHEYPYRTTGKQYDSKDKYQAV